MRTAEKRAQSASDDGVVLTAIRAGHSCLAAIQSYWRGPGVLALGRSARVDRALQRLRRAGRVEFTGQGPGQGWREVAPKQAAAGEE